MKQELSLPNGSKSVTEVVQLEDHDPIVTHFVEFADGTRSTKTCTCTCAGGGSDSKTCDASSQPTCDCTGKTAKIIC